MLAHQDLCQRQVGLGIIGLHFQGLVVVFFGAGGISLANGSVS